MVLGGEGDDVGETTSDFLVYVMEPVLALACVGAELAVFLVGLAGVFLLWHPSEGTLSIHSVDTRRREGFYWAGLGWGTGPVSLTLAGGIALVVAYLSWRERRKPAALG